jgi:hypothetical protein
MSINSIIITAYHALYRAVKSVSPNIFAVTRVVALAITSLALTDYREMVEKNTE